MLVKVNTPLDGVDGADGADGVDVDEAADTGYGMLPLDAELSNVSAVLPAFRTQTATRYAENSSEGVHVHVLFVDQTVCWYHCAPSKIHHLY
jgi:hypothetical protein